MTRRHLQLAIRHDHGLRTKTLHFCFPPHPNRNAHQNLMRSNVHRKMIF